MNNNYVQDVLNRLAAIEKEIPTIPVANNAVPYAFYVQEQMPYWINRVISARVTTNSQDYRVYKYRIGMCYIRAFVTEGLTFQPEAGLYADIPVISDYIGGVIQLQSKVYPTQMQYLDPIGVYLEDIVVYLNQKHSGVGQPIVGAEFILSVPIEVPTPQRY